MKLWPALLARPSPTPLASRPSLTLFYLLVGAFFLTFVPHVEQLPLWVSVSVVIALAIRCFLEYYRLPLPSTAFTTALALCVLAGICLQFNTMFGKEAGTAFMAGLMAVKFFELRGPRDIAVIIFASFFVVMSALLYSQALELFIYCLIMMWILTALLLRTQLGDLPEDHLLRMLRRAGFIFLQALPLTLILFFFFPRFTGKLQMSLNESPLGLSDTVEPGSISQLAKNDDTAFYALLSGKELPLVDSMYWRALVLWSYQRGVWKVGGSMTDGTETPPPQASVHSEPITQEIFITAHFKRWLFGLDHPITRGYSTTEPDSWSELLKGGIIQIYDPHGQVNHKLRYTVTSSLQLAPQRLRDDMRAFSLRLPGINPPANAQSDPVDRIDPQVIALADQLWAENPTPKGYETTVLRYFRHNLKYSSAPGKPPKGKDWLPYFLFQNKVGFCEHWASAFAVLMRLKDIPSRLVVGYQGALFNPYDNCYIVKQSNAHAWDEIWIDDASQPPESVAGKWKQGQWQRVDPTALAAATDGSTPGPNNPDNSSNDEGLSIQVAHHRLTLVSGAYLPGWMRRGLLDFQLRRQQVEANWDDFVFSYDPQAQDRLARLMGFGANSGIFLAFGCALSVAVCVVIFRRWIRLRPVIPPTEKSYAIFCRTMAQRGIPRAVWEGPLAYTERAAEAFPDKRQAIQGVGRIVAYARYGPISPDPSTSGELDSLIASIATTPVNSPASLVPNETP